MNKLKFFGIIEKWRVNMKRKIIGIICGLFVLLTAGCQVKENVKNEIKDKSKSSQIEMSHSDEYIAGEDSCNNYLLDGITPIMVPDKDGYYYINDYMLLYYDKNADKSVYVCSKPDCKHDKSYNSDCYANLYYCDEIIYKYKDNLYIVEEQSDIKTGTSAEVLTRLSLDASEREALYSFYNVADGVGYSYASCIHRGYFYYAVADDGSSEKETVKIYRRALEKDASEELFYESEENYGVQIGCLKGYGNEIYFDELGFRKKESDEYMKLKKCNIHTKKDKMVKEEFRGYYEKIGDKIYMQNLNMNMLIEYDENTGEEKELYSFETDNTHYSNIRSDGQYLYLFYVGCGDEDKNTLQIIDLEGNLVDTLEDVDDFLGGDDTYLFFRKMAKEYSEEEKEDVMVYHMYYYKKSDIGSGDYSLRTEMKPE